MSLRRRSHPLMVIFRNFWRICFLGVLLSIAVGIFLCFSTLTALFAPKDIKTPSGDALVLSINIDGIILESNEIRKKLRKHISKKSIKAVIIRVNSPGGAVGPSQDIHRELIALRKEFKKPIIMSFDALAASGAYYISVGADKIVTNPGSLVGSIGVIMNFANLEHLYRWAKVEPYTLKTGKFKDTGAGYRSMTEEERSYLQMLLNEVLDQFKTAIVEGRKMNKSVVDEHADGRVFTGATAVALGFADKIGNFSDAIDLAEEMTGEKELEVFDPSQSSSFLERLYDLEGLWQKIMGYPSLPFSSYTPTPMYLMPSL